MSLRAGAISPSDVASLRQRYPRAFARTPLQRAVLAGMLLGLFVFVVFCLWRFDASPMRIWNGLDRLGRIAGALFPPTPGDAFWDLVKAMLETIGMAFLGTLIATVIAFGLGFLGARNVVKLPLLRFPIRRSFDFLRGVDALVWALVYVRAVGLGPLAGVLAIATTDIGILSKLFAEAIENVDTKQVDGVQATGANAVQRMRFGIIPQVLPIMISNALYMFEFEHPLRHHSRDRGRRRHRLPLVRPHPGASLGGGRLHHHHDHRGGRADRLHLASAAQPADQGRQQSRAARYAATQRLKKIPRAVSSPPSPRCRACGRPRRC